MELEKLRIERNLKDFHSAGEAYRLLINLSTEPFTQLAYQREYEHFFGLETKAKEDLADLKRVSQNYIEW